MVRVMVSWGQVILHETGHILGTCLKVTIYSELTVLAEVKVKVHTVDIAPLHSESPPQRRSGVARVLNGSHSFTCTPTRSSAVGMSHSCLCLSSYSWYSFTDP